MESFLSDAQLQAIAAENNLAETAFLVSEGGDSRLRWFTPTTEVPLCAHATLASAAVVMERLEPGRSSVVFHSASGPLTVHRTDAGYVMDFPVRASERVSTPPGLADALAVVPIEVFANDFNYMALLESAAVLRELAPDMAALARINRPGVIMTAPGDGVYDFISRYFAPAKGIPEDPVTGLRTACWRPIGLNDWAKLCFAPIRLHGVAERSFAGWSAIASNWKALVFSTWKAKWRSEEVHGVFCPCHS